MNITDLAKQYNQLQSEIGHTINDNIENTITSLFAEHFRKIINGEVTVQNRNALKDQLATCREMAGNWTIEVKDISPFQDPLRCLIRYHLFSDKLGTFDVMATLRGNLKGHIEEVDEVYYIM